MIYEPSPQNPPDLNDNIPIRDLVIQDLMSRSEYGKSLYGDYLRADNGRNNLKDLYEELLDAAMYIRLLMEQEV
jgi:hypothetical protein